ncbi:MAG: hypothetical protein M3P84_05155, partial [Chloroflexota bacterium]|nr:hypothetical protein [Chloroflexota bacterium]
MRTTTIADHRDWVFEGPARRPARAPTRRRARNLLATLAIAVIPVLLLPVMSAMAATPKLTVSPAQPVADKTLNVSATGLGAR